MVFLARNLDKEFSAFLKSTRRKRINDNVLSLKEKLKKGKFLTIEDANIVNNKMVSNQAKRQEKFKNCNFLSIKKLKALKFVQSKKAKWRSLKMRAMVSNANHWKSLERKFKSGKLLSLHEIKYVQDGSGPSNSKENSKLSKELKRIALTGKNIAKGKFNGFDISHFISLEAPKKVSSISKKYITFETNAVLQNIDECIRPDLLVDHIFDYVMNVALKDHKKKPDLVNLQMFGDGMDQVYFVPLRSLEQNNSKVLAALFNQLAQSEKLASIFNSQLLIKICAAWIPNGGNCVGCEANKHVVPCNTNNSFCLARAIVYGLAAAKKNKRQLNDYIHTQLDSEAEKLMKDAGLSLKKKTYNLTDVGLLQKHVSARIVIFDQFKGVIFKGEEGNNDLYLSLINNHFDFIPVLTQFLKCNRFCVDCERPVSRIFHFKECRKCCRACLRYGGDAYPCQLEPGKSAIKCIDCGYWFNRKSCFDFHKSTKTGQRNHRSLCQERYYCNVCGNVVQKRGNKIKHTCEDVFNEPVIECKTCDIIHSDAEKYCYIQPIKHQGNPIVRYIFFDCETQTIDGVHVVILVCVTILCSACMDEGIDPGSDVFATNCACFVTKRKQTFKGFTKDSTPILEFLKFVLVRATKKKMPLTIILSHGGGKFDIHFCVNPLLENGIRPEITSVGFKIYRLDITKNGNKFTFKDSYNFMMQPLAKLPATYNFEAKKGYFPYEFIKQKNLFKVLSTLPKLKYYDVDNMRPKERSEFLEWYEEHKHESFCLADQIISYCELDVDILQKSCVEYRKNMIEATNIDPFFFGTTAPKFAMEVFRRNFLKPNQMVNAPEHGYRSTQKTKASTKGLKFIKWYAAVHDLKIQEATWKAGEFKVPGTSYFLDGVVLDEGGNPVKGIEFLGCYFHGCQTCYPLFSTKLTNGKNSIDLFTETMDRINEIKKIMPLEYFWECEADKLIKKERKFKDFYKNISVPPIMELRRDAFRGGRTENFKFGYTCKDDEEIISVDIISLYPYIKKYGDFMVNNPKVITGESIKNLPWTKPSHNPYRGFILCKVLPPPSRELAALPYRTKNGYITFPLCSTCCENRSSSKCRHSINKRAWIAAFSHKELNAGLARNYTVLEVYEVWDYPNWSTELFTGYVNTFLKYKIENSGWKNVQNKAEFIKQYKIRENIDLEPDAITVNPGKAACGKLLSNSLWGKMAQRAELSKVVFTNTPKSFWNILLDDKIEVLDITKVSESIDRIVIRDKSEFQKQPLTNNLPVACFVTSQARLRLLHFMEQIKPKRLLYVDTDSIFYIHKKGEPKVTEGEFLGDMARDMSDRRIFDFYAGGPKNYGYKHHARADPTDVQETLKVRGFPLTFKASKGLTYKAMKKATINQAKYGQDDDKNGIDVEYFTITRSKTNILRSKTMIKRWRPVFKKGIIKSKSLSIKPYGYRKK